MIWQLYFWIFIQKNGNWDPKENLNIYCSAISIVKKWKCASKDE